MDAPSIEIVEVGPRDGLQNEKVILSTADKVTLISALVEAGARRIEVASFVNPARVPQMADAEAVLAALPRRPEVTYVGLALNLRGAARAIDADIGQIGAVAVASDTFGKRNQGQTALESAAEVRAIAALAAQHGMGLQATISMAFGCPFEGVVPPQRVVELVERMGDLGLTEIGLADTVGMAVPGQVSELIGRVREAAPHLPVRAHFHDTRNTGLANVWAAVQAGASSIDASVGGLGGCPFSPGATGNVATEDVVYLLERSGMETGLDLEALRSTAAWVNGRLERSSTSALMRAGDFRTVQV